MRPRPVHPFACREMRRLPPKARSQAAPARRGAGGTEDPRAADRVADAALRGIEVVYIEPEVIELR